MKRLPIVLGLTIALTVGLSIRPVGATHDRAAGYGSFAGSWYFHGFNLEVTSGGNVYAVYRTYVWCGAGQRFGCDRIAGNQIYSGGLWAAHLQKPRNATASGIIGASADPSLDGTSVVLKRRPHDFLLLTWGPAAHRMQNTLCGPHVPVPTNKCGA